MTDCLTGGRVGAWEETGRGALELGSGSVGTKTERKNSVVGRRGCSSWTMKLQMVRSQLGPRRVWVKLALRDFKHIYIKKQIIHNTPFLIITNI